MNVAHFVKVSRQAYSAVHLFLIFFSLALLCVVWSAIYIELENTKQITIRAAFLDMENLSNTFEREVLLSIRSSDQLAKLIKFELESGSRDLNLQNLLDRTFVKSKLIVLVTVANEKGQVSATSQGNLNSPVDISDRTHFKVHMRNDSGGLYIGAPVIGRISKTASLNISRRINRPDGTFGGVVVVSLTPAALTGFYNENDFGKNGLLSLLGYDGIYRAVRTGPLSRTVPPISVRQTLVSYHKAAELKVGLKISAIDEIPRFSAIRPVEGYPLFVGVGIRTRDVLAPLEKQASIVYFCGVLATLLIIVFMTVVAFFAVKARLLNEQLVKDIEMQKVMKDALIKSENRFRHLADLSSDWYWEQDSNFRFTILSVRESTQNGKILAGFLGKTLRGCPIKLSTLQWSELEADVKAGRAFSDLEYEFSDGAGLSRWFAMSGEPLFDDALNCTGYRGVGKDITDRKEADKKIQYMALHDPLTGLPNRVLFEDRLAQAIEYGKRHTHSVWVLFIDLDGFKLINDTIGHKAGDRFLVETATRLQSILRVHDTVARFGGDEFVLVLAGGPPADLNNGLIRRIIDNVGMPLQLEGRLMTVTCSIGAAIYPTDSTSAETLVEYADEAMYKAKQAGKNQFSFYSSEVAFNEAHNGYHNGTPEA